MEVTLEMIFEEIKKLNKVLFDRPEFSMAKQQQMSAIHQERQMITQLQMEGYTKDEAVKYYERMLNGEKPWMEDA